MKKSFFFIFSLFLSAIIFAQSPSETASNKNIPSVILGYTGATGPKGDKGDTGPAGTNGIDGANGATGQKGDKGNPGETGPTGVNGIDGANGATGQKGDKGDPGDIGPAGANGTDGANGATGQKGDKGDPGETGPAGTDGEPDCPITTINHDGIIDVNDEDICYELLGKVTIDRPSGGPPPEGSRINLHCTSNTGCIVNSTVFAGSLKLNSAGITNTFTIEDGESAELNLKGTTWNVRKQASGEGNEVNYSTTESLTNEKFEGNDIYAIILDFPISIADGVTSSVSFTTTGKVIGHYLMFDANTVAAEFSGSASYRVGNSSGSFADSFYQAGAIQVRNQSGLTLSNTRVLVKYYK